MGTEGDDCRRDAGRGDDNRVIAGRYRLEERIGRGGMGVVWRASDAVLGRLVAVKELAPDDFLSDDDALRRRDHTFREARAVAQLRHPHIIVVHDVLEHEERPYIVMELIEGGALSDRIDADGPVSPVEAARIGAALLSALRTAHESGILHRDVKPANVLIESGTGRVVLTDFGIAQVAGATTLTETGSFVGSPEYTAPERMSGVRTGPESDLWSLGALLCTALSGESPFRRDSLGGILHAVVTADIRPPAQAEPLLPVVRGLLERDPDRRLGAAEAERMLRVFLETGRTPPAPDVPGTGRAYRSGTTGARGIHLPAGHPSSYRPTGHDERRGSVGQAAPPGGQPPPVSRSARGMLVAALLAAAVAGAGVSAVALLLHRSGDGGGGTPGSTASGPATGTRTTASLPMAPTVTRGPAGTGAPTGSPGAANALTVPSGYRSARDPAGFSLAVPRDFTRERQDQRVFYLSPTQTFRLGIKVTEPEPGGPAAVLARAAAGGPGTNPGYRDGRVTGTRHAGHRAALWEFTWDGFSAAEGPRHTYDLCWEEAGRMYDVWVSAPVGKAREARQYFDVALDTFSAKAP